MYGRYLPRSFVVNREGLADEAGLSVYKIKLCL